MRARRPDEAAPLKAFVRHHQTGAVKQQHLDPVAALRTEHHDHAGMDVDAELMAGHHRKTIVTVPEINRTVHRKTNHNPMAPDHHLSGHAASRAIPDHHRISDPEEVPAHTRRHHVERHCGKRPWRRATSWTVTPGSKLSKTIRALTSSGHPRRAGTAGPCASSHCRTKTPFSIAFPPRHGHVVKIAPDSNQCIRMGWRCRLQTIGYARSPGPVPRFRRNPSIRKSDRVDQRAFRCLSKKSSISS